MKLFVFLILLSPILFSCGTSEDVIIDNISIEPEEIRETVKDYNVEISISQHSSYCGGMAPSPEMLARLNSMQKNTDFILVNLDTGTKANVKTDSTGVLRLSLTMGKYAVREHYKNCSYEEFLAQQQSVKGEYSQSTGGDDCYKDWWASNLIEFEIEKVDSVLSYEVGTYSKCFTGYNPCLIYNGPKPP